MIKELKNKGIKKFYQWIKRYGYIISCTYEIDGMTIVEISKTCAGISIEDYKITFSEKFRIKYIEKI